MFHLFDFRYSPRALTGIFFSATVFLSSATLPSFAQSHRGRMDTDGILSPGEIPNPSIDYGGRNPGGGRLPSTGSRRCDQLSYRDIGEPGIDIFRVKSSGNVFGSGVKVSGSVEGVCLSEAGLFENGRRVQSIPINTETRFGRYEFEVKTSTDKRPEIRVYATNGARFIVPVQPE